MRYARLVFAVLLLGLMSACGNMGSKANQLTSTLLSYQQAVRWGQLQDAVAFLDPAYLAEHPVSHLTLSRFEQLQVVGYRIVSEVVVDDQGFARQTVQIELVNKHTQSPRSVVDKQVWQMNKELKRWVLISGLPKLEANEDS